MFVGIFTVLLAMGAFVLNQGLFQDRRRIAQKDADAAARAGAAAYLSTESLSSQQSDAVQRARAMAHANGATPGASEPLAVEKTSADCPTLGGMISGAPSVEVAIKRPAPTLFNSAWFSNLTGAGDNIGASSTACVGSVLTIGPDTTAGRPLNLPVEINTSDRQSKDNLNACFASDGTPRIGEQCVIIRDATTKEGYLHEAGSAGQCTGAIDSITPAIERGEDWTCTVNTGASCSDPFAVSTSCASPADTNPTDTLTSWNRRLSGATFPSTCRSEAFADTFDYADGSVGPVSGPTGVGGSDPPVTVYVQKRCSNPRVGIVIVSDGNGRPVRGFAAVYIVGCFDPTAPLTTETNTCSSGEGAGHHEGDEGNGGGQVEVRAVLLRLYMTSGAVGGIGPIDALSPVTIQTTR